MGSQYGDTRQTHRNGKAALESVPAGARRFRLRFDASKAVALLATSGAILLLLCGGIALLLAMRSDDNRDVEQGALLRSATEEFRVLFAELTLPRVRELEGAAAGGLSYSHHMARLSPLTSSRFRHEKTFLINADGELAGAFPHDDMVPLPLRRLVAEFRADPASQIKVAGDVPPLRSAAVVADYVTIDGRPAIAAVALLHDARVGSAAPALVAMTRIDHPHIETFKQASGLTNLVVHPSSGDHGGKFQALLDRHGRIVGWFSWQEQRPMTQAIVRMSPLFGFGAFCLFGVAGVSTSLRRRSSKAAASGDRSSDFTTGLANRAKVLQALERALEIRPDERIVGFAFIDVDNFKEVNDALGHYGGDELLGAIAERLHGAAPAGALIGRIGSDEFAIVVESDDADEPMRAAKFLADAMTRPFWAAGQVVQMTASIGVAQSPRDGVGPDEIIRRADLALRTAKKLGYGRIVQFASEMEIQLQDQAFIKKELRKALGDGNLEVHYQPIVASDGVRVVGVEALLRWDHPTRGPVPPAAFIPIAEQSSLMDALGEFVLRKALADAMRWPDLYIAINVSPVQMKDRGFIDTVGAVIEETRIEPSRVILEVTEGVLIDNPHETKRRLEKLRGLGVRIALDDYGIGYSSLKYLQRFPFDKLKIDKEFVTPLGRSANGAVIIHSIVGLGRALGLSVLAEGVETEEQRILLRLAGCDEMQGFLFASPSPREVIDLIVAKIDEQGNVVEPMSRAPQAARFG